MNEYLTTRRQLEREIAERRRVEQELRESEERFRSLVETANDAIICADALGNVTLWNRTAKDIFQYSPEEIMGKPISFLMPERFRAAHEKGLKRLVGGGEPRVIGRTVELVGARKDGTEFPLELSLSTWEQDSKVFFTAILHEITRRKQAEESLAAERERLAVTLGSIGDGVISTDIDGNVVLLNRVAEELTGWRLDEAAGKPLSAVFNIINEKTREPADNPVTRALKSGVVVGLANHTALISKDGTEVSIADSCAPIRALDGSVIGTVLVFRDVTEERQIERLGEALNEINSAINSTLDSESIMRAVVVQAAEALNCGGSIEMRRQGYWEVTHTHGLAAKIRGRRIDFGQARDLEVMVKTKVPYFVGNSEVSDLLGKKVIDKFDIKSMMLVPIIMKEEVVGALRFLCHSAAASFGEAQVNFAQTLAASVSLALENARLYATEKHIAETLQGALLRTPNELPGVKFGYLYKSATEAAKVGGDFYDLFEIEPGKIGVLIGDVAGKGVSAATLTAMVTTAVKAFAYQGCSPAEILDRTNHILRRETKASAFATAFFGVLDIENRQLRYCSGGHPPAILRRRIGSVEYLPTICPIIGAFDEMSFEDCLVPLASGDTLVLYTDGITEARCPGGEFYGEDRLLEMVHEPKRAPELTDHIFERVMDFTSGELADDVAILSVALTVDE